MDVVPPLRLLRHDRGVFALVYPRDTRAIVFDILSYTWGKPEETAYGSEVHGIAGVTWELTIARQKLEDIKRFMVAANVEYLWVDCVCIKQDDEQEKSTEVTRMGDYYRAALTCHVLMDMPEVWDPQQIVSNLKFVDHVLGHMSEATLAAQAPGLTPEMRAYLEQWADAQWTFAIPKNIVRAAAIDMGVLNCYSTCVNNVMSLFKNPYFTRVWTFQEMILGKNIRMWAIDSAHISDIGQLNTWIDLATESMLKAAKLHDWIVQSRALMSASVSAITRVIEEDIVLLRHLQLVVMGIEGARTDIISGGPSWWYDNHKGISNIFSAIAIIPRTCSQKADLFRGLLGIFSGLFNDDEIRRDVSGEDTETMSFNFFKQLSIKTEHAWTKLAVSTAERGDRDWIPVVEGHSGVITTECFAGVMKLGKTDTKGRAKAEATTGLKGTPRKFASVRLLQSISNNGYQFVFQGCNCGKKVKTGHIHKQLIPTTNQPRDVVKDETGRILVHCATVLGSLLDPDSSLVDFRKKLLRKLQPNWQISDPNAKPTKWEDRCVSGTSWEDPHPHDMRVHNRSFNYRMVDLNGFDCQLATENTAKVSCEVRVNCGCIYIAPFSFIFQGLTAVAGSSLGDLTAVSDDDRRIKLQDGSGLVQIGDVGKTFNLVAFDGDVSAYKSYATLCRRKKVNKRVPPQRLWPSGRALVSEDFSHGLTSQMRDYGYVDTEGSGNLLICRNHLADPYRIIGACLDKRMVTVKEGTKSVKIR